MVRADVIVIGGGVAGLAAAAELARHDLHVVLLEARERLGGRVLTLRREGWGGPIELGPEFVHGGNAALWRILKRHRLRTRRAPPRHWLARDGRLERLRDAAAAIENVTGEIDAEAMEGWSFADFMRCRGGAFSAVERQLAAGFVEGFQAAPPQRMSAPAIEGETIDDTEQFLLPNGYDTLVDGLVSQLRPDRVEVWRGTVATQVHWSRGKVTVQTRDGEFVGRALITTLPLGVWQARPRERGAVRFQPALRAKERLVRRMGVSHVIRLDLRFDPRRWRSLLPSELRRAARGGFGFIHSRDPGVPVWWALSDRPMMTGWAGGPSAETLAKLSQGRVMERAFASLGRLLGTTASAVRRAVAAAETHNWSRDPFSRGAYSFIAAGQEEAGEKLRIPVRDTLFFAGEATADAEEVGTVHGALSSGLRAAGEVMRAVG